MLPAYDAENDGATRHMSRFATLLALLALCFAAAGCGGDGGGEEASGVATCPPGATPSTEATTLQIPADAGGDLAFQKDSLTAPSGRVTLVMENPSSEVHNIAVEGDGVDVKGKFAGRGERSRVAVDLEPGEYAFYCSVPLHRSSGMEGTLTVTC